MARRKRRKRKAWSLAVVEYAGAWIGFTIVHITPAFISRFLARRLGDIFYTFWIRRRRVARSNLAIAFPELTDENEIRRIIRSACRSFFLTFLEMIKAGKVFKGENPAEALERIAPGFAEKARALRELYERTGGFILVTAHLGNWECLLRVAEVVGIPLVVVARPLDNPLLQKLVYSHRLGSGQEIVPKYNVLYALRNALRRRKCVAVLGDQRAGRRGIMAPFFGRPASTHRTPAMLAIQFSRPIVVVAACRTAAGFDGLVSDPILPDVNAPERKETYRLTTAINEQIAEFIRKYPEQYLWAHNRWKHASPPTEDSAQPGPHE